MSAPAIAVENLEKYFPPAQSGWRSLLHPIAEHTVCALADLSFAIQKGEAMALVGHNGAGKTTLMRILATLVVPTRGRATLDGFDVARNSAQARQRLGYHTGGDEGFYGRLSGRENLAFFAAMNNLTGEHARAKIASAAERIGLSAELDRQTRTYSTGMRHSLGLARALLHDPAVLLLDEPTRSLDPLAAADFRRLLKDDIVRRRGTTLLFASHTLSEVEEIADRIILLDHGKMVACDSPPGLIASARTPTLEAAISRILRPAATTSSIQ
jgi:ABC-2 type transport system ATP-binding protein